MRKPSSAVYVFQIIAALIMGIPIAIVGILLIISIIFAPVGFVVMGVAAIPLFWVQKNHIKKMTAWQFRDKPLYEREARIRPWEE